MKEINSQMSVFADPSKLVLTSLEGKKSFPHPHQHPHAHSHSDRDTPDFMPSFHSAPSSKYGDSPFFKTEKLEHLNGMHRKDESFMSSPSVPVFASGSTEELLNQYKNWNAYLSSSCMLDINSLDIGLTSPLPSYPV
jgi:hypothetical protein